MKTQRLLLVVVCAVTVSSCSFAAVVKNVSSSVFLQMTGNAGCSDMTATDSDSQAGTLKNLKAQVGAKSSCTNPKRSVEVTGKVVAKWTNAAQGTVDFTGVGWNTKNVTDGYANDNEGLDYSYTFSTKNKPLFFSFDWDIAGNGVNDDFGLNGFFIDLNGSSIFANVDSTGATQWLLSPNTTYTLTISNEANDQGALGTIKEVMDGHFSFLAYSVPEPSSWMLLSSGLIAAVGMIRRRVL